MLIKLTAAAILGFILLIGCSGMPMGPTQAEKQAVAPTGKLRAGMLANNPVHATKDPATGKLKGVAFDIATELARRLDVPLEVVTYETLPKLINSAQTGESDIIFVGISPERAQKVDFSAPYSRVEMGYLVAKGAPISNISEVDRPRVRIAVQQKGAADVLLTSTLKNATLVRGPTISDAVELVRSDRADALAGIKTFLFPASDRLPGSRVLDGHIAVEDLGIGVPKGRELGAAYVRKFVDKAKSEGFIKAAVDRSGVRGLMASP